MFTEAAPDGIAEALAGRIGAAARTEPLTRTHPGFGAAEAAAVRNRLHARSLAAGARAAGRKIGFTNTTIWPVCGVDRPIWSHVYDTTVRAAAPAALNLAAFAEPRIEPEIVLGLARAPRPGMTAEERSGCLGWIAAGFAIVRSVYPGWRFAGPDATAAMALHGALVLGPRRPVQPAEGATVTPTRDGAAVATGAARNVLGGPPQALAHLVVVPADEPGAPPLAAGEIVSTGTLTDAMPVGPGERWTADFAGIDLPAPVLCAA